MLRRGSRLSRQVAIRLLLPPCKFYSQKYRTDCSPAFGQGTNGEASISPNATIMKQLASQLDQWRGMLPVYLRWQEDQPDVFSGLGQDMFDSSIYQQIAPDYQSTFMFSSDLDSPPVNYPYMVDIQAAWLRTRYYHAKYLIHRPYLFKALHHPEQTTREDADGVAVCLKSCLKWPIIMSPVCSHKRLVPYLFFWTQNVLGILVVLHLSEKVPILSRVRRTMCGTRFESDAAETATLCIDWIRDLKAVDPSAKWSWNVLKCLYPVDD